MPADQRVLPENAEYEPQAPNGRVVPDRSTKPVYLPSAPLLTDEEKALIHAETALLLEKNRREKELRERLQEEQRENLGREEQEVREQPDTEASGGPERQQRGKDDAEKRESEQAKREERESSAKRGRELTGVKRQNRSEHQTTDAKKSVEDRGKGGPELQDKLAEVPQASVPGESSAGKVQADTGEAASPVRCVCARTP